MRGDIPRVRLVCVCLRDRTYAVIAVPELLHLAGKIRTAAARVISARSKYGKIVVSALKMSFRRRLRRTTFLMTCRKWNYWAETREPREDASRGSGVNW